MTTARFVSYRNLDGGLCMVPCDAKMLEDTYRELAGYCAASRSWADKGALAHSMAKIALELATLQSQRKPS